MGGRQTRTRIAVGAATMLAIVLTAPAARAADVESGSTTVPATGFTLVCRGVTLTGTTGTVTHSWSATFQDDGSTTMHRETTTSGIGLVDAETGTAYSLGGQGGKQGEVADYTVDGETVTRTYTTRWMVRTTKGSSFGTLNRRLDYATGAEVVSGSCVI